jgi:hypothetical protein
MEYLDNYLVSDKFLDFKNEYTHSNIIFIYFPAEDKIMYNLHIINVADVADMNMKINKKISEWLYDGVRINVRIQLNETPYTADDQANNTDILLNFIVRFNYEEYNVILLSAVLSDKKMPDIKILTHVDNILYSIDDTYINSYKRTYLKAIAVISNLMLHTRESALYNIINTYIYKIDKIDEIADVNVKIKTILDDIFKVRALRLAQRNHKYANKFADDDNISTKFNELMGKMGSKYMSIIKTVLYNMNDTRTIAINLYNVLKAIIGLFFNTGVASEQAHNIQIYAITSNNSDILTFYQDGNDNYYLIQEIIKNFLIKYTI